MDLREWKPLETQALWLLAHADQAPPREPLHGMALQLRLWHYPPSGKHVSWSVILPVREYRGRRAIVRELTWDRPRDWKRKPGAAVPLPQRENLEPSVRRRDAEILWEDLSPYLDAAGGLRTELPDRAALPGTTGLEGSRSFAHVRLEWRGRGSKASAAAIAWFERFRKLLLRLLREQESGASGR